MPNLPIHTIVLHYSATYADQDLDVRDIDRMHRARGFNGVGYHYVIKRDGMIERGRKETVKGAHVKGHNTGTIGICLIGGLERATGPNVGVDNRTEAQKRSAASLIRDLLTRYPGAKVVGHRDLGPTQCPGYDAAAWWASVVLGQSGHAAPRPKLEFRTGSPRLTSIFAAIAAILKAIFGGKKP